MEVNYPELIIRGTIILASIVRVAILLEAIFWGAIIQGEIVRRAIVIEPHKVFFCEFCEISNNTSFYRTPLVAASVVRRNKKTQKR